MAGGIRSHIFRVLDVETTGLDPTDDRIVEISYAVIRGDGEILSSGTSRVNPGRAISPAATEVHHITDADVMNAPSMEALFRSHPDLHSPAFSGVCHNAAFDSQFLYRYPLLVDSIPKLLCTLELSRNLLPGNPSYRLEYLAETLKLPSAHSQFHSAEQDVRATCELLSHLIDCYLGEGHPDDIDQLFQMATVQRMPFGKHRGELLDEMPNDYVDWLLREANLDQGLRDALLRLRRRPAPLSPILTFPPATATVPAVSERAKGKKRWWWPF